MRALLPNNAVAYLETDSLGKMLESTTESRAFQELAESKPDFSALENIQIALAVTDFETSEENAALNFKPKFVAVAETHLWSWQTVSLADNQLDNFVRKNYGAETKRETEVKTEGKFYTWTANDKRQVYAFVTGSLIYFGTDRATIDIGASVKNGETDSLLKNESLARVYQKNNLAFGYVSTEGIRKIADFVGVNTAVETTEESAGRSFIAGILPQILQNTAREIVWTANRTELGIEDKYTIALNDETAQIAAETFAAAERTTANLTAFLPADFFSATRYNLRQPLAAWRGLLLISTRNADILSGKILTEFSGKLLEPYKIADAEMFLGAIDSEIITAQFDENGDQSVTIAAVKDAANLKNSIAAEINFKAESQKQLDAEIWFSADRRSAAAFVGNRLILGDAASVLKCLQSKKSGNEAIKNASFQRFATSRAVAATFAKDLNSADTLAGVLAKKKSENRRLATFYFTETNFSRHTFERATVSDFGLIGTILSQLK